MPIVCVGVMRGVGDPQLVAVWLAVTDVERARQYFADKAIRARLRAARDGQAALRLQLIAAALDLGLLDALAALLGRSARRPRWSTPGGRR